MIFVESHLARASDFLIQLIEIHLGVAWDFLVHLDVALDFLVPSVSPVSVLPT